MTQREQQVCGTYRVLARGNTLVPDYAQMKATHRLAFIARTVHRAPTVEALPLEARDAPIRARDAVEWTGEEPSVEAWVATKVPVELISAERMEPEQREAGQYNRERIAEGGLWAADAETAAACGVAFDPSFGGEYPELVRDATAPVDKGRKE